MRIFGSILLLSLTIPAVYSQTPIDTITNIDGKRFVVFSDRSMKEIDHGQVLRQQGDEIMVNLMPVKREDYSQYPTLEGFDKVQLWSNDYCYQPGDYYGVRNMKDTLLLNLNIGDDEFVDPVKSNIVTSTYKFRWGHYHKGVDIGVHTGDTVVAAWSGKVRYAEYNRGGYGNLVIIRHANGLETYYAHNSRLLVKPNEEVKAGQPISLAGSTGHSTGPHLHFEVRFFDQNINPEEIIDFRERKLKKDELLVCSSLFRPGALPSDVEEHRESIYDNTQSVASVAKSVRTTNHSSARYYRVRPGDNLGKIAARNNTTISRLCQLNRISRTTILQPGRNLRVR